MKIKKYVWKLNNKNEFILKNNENIIKIDCYWWNNGDLNFDGSKAQDRVCVIFVKTEMDIDNKGKKQKWISIIKENND